MGDWVLGDKAYDSIPHLPGSRTGAADRHLPLSIAVRCTNESRAGDRVIVTEKLDGSCVAIVRVDGAIHALGRGGDLASASRNEGRRMFASWVASRSAVFLTALVDGERLVGEWLALAHSTRYQIGSAPFVAFDLMVGRARRPRTELVRVGAEAGVSTAAVVHDGAAIDVETVMARVGQHGGHRAVDPPEGAVWRVEAGGRVVVVAKFVRADKVDGALLSENTEAPSVWNWRPD